MPLLNRQNHAHPNLDHHWPLTRRLHRFGSRVQPQEAPHAYFPQTDRQLSLLVSHRPYFRSNFLPLPRFSIQPQRLLRRYNHSSQLRQVVVG